MNNRRPDYNFNDDRRLPELRVEPEDRPMETAVAIGATLGARAGRMIVLLVRGILSLVMILIVIELFRLWMHYGFILLWGHCQPPWGC